MQLDLTRFRQPVSHVARRFSPAELTPADSAEGDAYRVMARNIRVCAKQRQRTVESDC